MKTAEQEEMEKFMRDEWKRVMKEMGMIEEESSEKEDPVV